jgi:hypothetical protein
VPEACLFVLLFPVLLVCLVVWSRSVLVPGLPCWLINCCLCFPLPILLSEYAPSYIPGLVWHWRRTSAFTTAGLIGGWAWATASYIVHTFFGLFNFFYILRLRASHHDDFVDASGDTALHPLHLHLLPPLVWAFVPAELSQLRWCAVRRSLHSELCVRGTGGSGPWPASSTSFAFGSAGPWWARHCRRRGFKASARAWCV